MANWKIRIFYMSMSICYVEINFANATKVYIFYVFFSFHKCVTLPTSYYVTKDYFVASQVIAHICPWLSITLLGKLDVAEFIYWPVISC